MGGEQAAAKQALTALRAIVAELPKLINHYTTCMLSACSARGSLKAVSMQATGGGNC